MEQSAERSTGAKGAPKDETTDAEEENVTRVISIIERPAADRP